MMRAVPFSPAHQMRLHQMLAAKGPNLLIFNNCADEVAFGVVGVGVTYLCPFSVSSRLAASRPRTPNAPEA
jgi:hypothetical protein